jgi:hypothetical protein
VWERGRERVGRGAKRGGDGTFFRNDFSQQQKQQQQQQKASLIMILDANIAPTNFSLKSKVGLAAAIAAALRINLNVEGCGIVAAPMHAASRAPLLLPLLLSHNLPLPRVH